MHEIFLSNHLTAIETATWQLLQEASISYKSPFHYAAVANIQDGWPEQRTVILRKTEPAQKKLYFHTDIRSPKAAWLKKDPAISWLFYNEPLKLQFRMSAVATVHYNNEMTEEAWLQSKTNSRLTYSIADAPGKPLQEPIPIGINDENSLDEIIPFAKNNFAVIETRILKIDFLFLHHTTNRRGIFDYQTNKAYWIQS